MAAQSPPLMPERWTELIASRRQRTLCAEQVEALKQSCESECGKTHISECPGCYEKVLERMRVRYTDSEDREWFTERRAFVQELAGLFTEAKQRKRSLRFIEGRIESEKEAWYRWMLRSHPEFLAVADGGAHQNELRGMLDDPDRSRQELVQMMWEGVGAPDDWSSRVDDFTERVSAAGGNKATLQELYLYEFFCKNTTGEPVPVEHAETYLAKYKGEEDKPGLPLEDVIGLIVQDSQANRSSQPHRDNHQRRLDELRRAKTAFEHNRAQAKSRPHGGQAGVAGDELYDLPPCFVCQREVDAKDVISCTICQAVTQLRGEKKLTVYCSEECYHKGHDDHTEKEHDCESAESCVQIYDEDVNMDDGDWSVACKECLDQKEFTVYCSEKCAVENLARHRQTKHGVKTAAEEVQSLVSPLGETISSILEAKNPGLQFSRVQ